MVLSLTADELVQAHFEALVAEGERKQVRLGERKREREREEFE